MKNVLLYGGGTQSTGLLLMALDGLFVVPDLTIFADTYSEPYFVYDYIRLVREYIENKYNYEIDVVFGGILESDIRVSKITGKRVASIPLYTENKGMIRRQCTDEYKIKPITRYLKEYFNIGRKTKDSKPTIKRWFGISLDEIERCKVSQDWWAENYYPLVEMRMYRHGVINYINKNHPELANPSRSSCYFCPFHSDNYWRMLKEKHPNEFRRAIEIDEIIRINPKLNNKCYLHRSCKPLSEVDFSKHGQLEIFGECDGYCGI